jgi:hypothetical protein
MKTYTIEAYQIDGDDTRLVLRVESESETVLFSNLLTLMHQITPNEFKRFMTRLRRQAEESTVVLSFMQAVEKAMDEDEDEKPTHAPDGSPLPEPATDAEVKSWLA